jgi:hypothetical protein
MANLSIIRMKMYLSTKIGIMGAVGETREIIREQMVKTEEAGEEERNWAELYNRTTWTRKSSLNNQKIRG